MGYGPGVASVPTQVALPEGDTLVKRAIYKSDIERRRQREHQFAASMGGGVVIHYDDANDTDYSIAFPKHKELMIPAVSNIITSAIGTPSHLTWEQLEEMVNSGLWEVGNHTNQTSNLTNLTAEQQQAAIDGGFLDILTNLGRPPLWFTPPEIARNGNIDALVFRLHKRQCSTIYRTAGWKPAFQFYRPSYLIRATDIPTLGDVPSFLDLVERDVYGFGSQVSLAVHRIGNHTGGNVGQDIWAAVLEGLVARHIPVLDPKALAQLRYNLVEDGSFEEESKYWSRSQGTGTATAADFDSTEAHSGAKSLKLSATTSNGSTAPFGQQVIPIRDPAITKYSLTLWHKASRDSGNYNLQTRIIYQRENGTTSKSESYPINKTVGTDWERTTVEVDVGTGTSYLVFRPQLIVGDSTPTDVWIDSVSLVPSNLYDYNAVDYPPLPDN